MNNINLQFTFEQTNFLLNVLDNPLNSSTMQRASFINLIQEQAAPQVKALQEAAEKEQANESTTASD